MAQAGSKDEKNRGSKISLDCPFKDRKEVGSLKYSFKSRHLFFCPFSSICVTPPLFCCCLSVTPPFLRFILLYHFFCPFILLRVTPPLRLSFCFTVTCVTPPLLLSLRLASSHTNTSLSIRLALCHTPPLLLSLCVPSPICLSILYISCRVTPPQFTTILRVQYMAAVTEIKMQIVFILTLFNNMNKK